MRPLHCLLVLLLLALPARSEQGQGPVDPGPIVVDDLRLGTYWFGARITNKDLLGKVVLVEAWGS